MSVCCSNGMMTKKHYPSKHLPIKGQSQSEPLVEKLAVQLNFTPTNTALFEEAFTHSSFANESGLPDNERLEFLGDSVLGIIVCNFLFHHYPSYNEGRLAKLKSTIVSTQILAAFAKNLGLERFLKLGQGEIRSHGRNKQSILEDLFEAFVGAYFLNFGLERTSELVLPLIEDIIPEVSAKTEAINAKTNLQEIAQAHGLRPEYQTVTVEGPPHLRLFTVEVMVNNRILARGTGSTIKEAQNQAALSGLEKLKELIRTEFMERL